MDWSNERYVRLYTRDTADWSVLSWEARGTFSLLLRVVDRAGVLEMGKHGTRSVAALLRMPADVVDRALVELLADGCVVQRGNHLVVPNFIEAQEAAASDNARSRASRERRRDLAKAGELGLVDESAQNVADETDGNDESRDATKRDGADTKRGASVTLGHAVSHAVTPSLAVPCLSVPSVPKDTPSAFSADRDSAPPLVLTDAPDPDGIGVKAMAVFVHWRKAAAKNANTVFSGDRRRRVEQRLREGFTVEQLCRAVDGCLLTPHNRGDNDRGEVYDDLELICRTGANVDRFGRNAQSPPKPSTGPPGKRPLQPSEMNFGPGGKVDGF